MLPGVVIAVVVDVGVVLDGSVVVGVVLNGLVVVCVVWLVGASVTMAVVVVTDVVSGFVVTMVTFLVTVVLECSDIVVTCGDTVVTSTGSTVVCSTILQISPEESRMYPSIHFHWFMAILELSKDCKHVVFDGKSVKLSFSSENNFSAMDSPHGVSIDWIWPLKPYVFVTSI